MLLQHVIVKFVFISLHGGDINVKSELKARQAGLSEMKPSITEGGCTDTLSICRCSVRHIRLGSLGEKFEEDREKML